MPTLHLVSTGAIKPQNGTDRQKDRSPDSCNMLHMNSQEQLEFTRPPGEVASHPDSSSKRGLQPPASGMGTIRSLSTWQHRSGNWKCFCGHLDTLQQAHSHQGKDSPCSGRLKCH
ncbi:hypothetical protein P7K49_031450 [Saguinus oedipus]|uniref:Uncharacterized protein n=1 Tax=Saguinus oedipus TaxID=9490 RepID=A0ABQ9TZG6_SAGOE|nr:hypothetical protein P7K49_031450 [Saguinus oedipus]